MDEEIVGAPISGTWDQGCLLSPNVLLVFLVVDLTKAIKILSMLK